MTQKTAFEALPIGAIFQTRDGRMDESATWVPVVKVSETEIAELIPNMQRVMRPGHFLSRTVETKDLRMIVRR